MTDGERAQEIVKGWLGIKVQGHASPQYLGADAVVAAAEAIVAALAAVRAEERERAARVAFAVLMHKGETP